MGQCCGVFNTWDEEYDKFTSQLREMSKKKREETLKFAWRANTAHKKLQDRTTRMREWVSLCARVLFVLVCHMNQINSVPAVFASSMSSCKRSLSEY